MTAHADTTTSHRIRFDNRNVLIYLLIPVEVCDRGGLCKIVNNGNNNEPFIIHSHRQYLFYPEESVYLTRVLSTSSSTKNRILYVLFSGEIDRDKPVYDLLFLHRLNFECFHYNIYDYSKIVNDLCQHDATTFTRVLSVNQKETNRWVLNISNVFKEIHPCKYLAIVLENDYTNNMPTLNDKQQRVNFYPNDEMLFRLLNCQINHVRQIQMMPVIIKRLWTGKIFKHVLCFPNAAATNRMKTVPLLFSKDSFIFYCHSENEHVLCYRAFIFFISLK